MSALSTEKTQILVKPVLALLLSELAIFSKLGGEIRVGFLLVGSVATRVVVVGITRSTSIAGVTLSAGVVFILLSVGSSVVVGGGALALIVGALRLQSGWSFSSHFGVAFPVMRVNGMGEGMEVSECVGFANAGNLILDTVQKSVVQLLVEGSFAPLDMSGEVVEVDEVLHDVLVFVHVEIFEVTLCFTFRVMWSEVFS